MTFPNYKNKFNSKPIVAPKQFMDYLKNINKYPDFVCPDGVILCYSKQLMGYILKNHKTKEVDSFYGSMYLLEESGDKIAIIGNFGIGAPVATTLLEELIAFGVKKFISIGTAGTINRDVNIGDLVICDRAIRDEGCSHHYLEDSKYSFASKNMVKKLKKKIESLNLNYIVGTSWTTDAPYRETVAEVEKYQKEGVLTVEMEAAALFAVAQYRDVDLGAIFTISDSLAELKWKPKFHSDEKRIGLELIYKIAISSLIY